MVNLGFTIGTITDYMPGCNGQKGLHNFSWGNTVEVLAPDLFGTLGSKNASFHHLARVRVWGAFRVLGNLLSAFAEGMSSCA